MNGPPARTGPYLPVLVVLLCAAGTVVSAMSTIDHVAFLVHNVAGGGLCAAISGADCSSAHSSPASEILGLPISLLGSAFYIGFAVLAVLAARSAASLPSSPAGSLVLRAFLWGPTALVVAAGASVVYSAWLASILIESGRLCAFCVALYVINGALLAAVVFWSWPGLRRPSFRAVVSCLAFHAVLSAIVLTPLAFAYNAAITIRLNDSAARSAHAPARSTPLDRSDWDPRMIPARVPLLGGPQAPTTLIEFSDFDCPFCAAMHKTISDLLREQGPQRIRVRFIQFPLDASCNPFVTDTLHEDACMVARAGICAEEFDIFWEFAASAFSERDRRGMGELVRFATELGADKTAFADCIGSEKTTAALNQDIRLAHAAGVTATPTTLVNRIRFEGLMTLDQLREVLDRSEVCSCDLLAEVCACDRENTPDCACGMQVVDSAACR